MRLLDWRAAWSAGAVVLAGLAVGAGSASACSCILDDPRRMLSRSDAAFVGVFLSKRELGAPRSSADPALYRFRVEDTVKGTLGDVIDVQSATSGASCGLEVTVGQRIGLFLERRGNAWGSNLCWQIGPARLRAAARPLPRPDGSGPAALLVGGKFGNVRTIALDRRARTLAYGVGAGETFAFSVCPGARRVAELVFDGPRTLLAVRELPSLRRVRELALPLARPTPVYANAVHCGDAAGGSIFVFASDSGSTSSPGPVSRLFRVRGRVVTTIHRGRGVECGFRGRAAYVTQGHFGNRLSAVDLVTGRGRYLARVPGGTGPVVASPDGRRLAAVAPSIPIGPSPAPTRVVHVDLARRPAAVRVASVGTAGAAGDVAWVNARRLVFLPERGGPDTGRVFDHSLRTLRRLGRWQASELVVTRGAAWGLVAETLLRAVLPGGRATVARTLPGPLTRTLAAVPPRRRATALWFRALW